MTKIAIIGGTGLNSLKTLAITHRQMVRTPYGAPSSPIVFGEVYDKPIVFLARHGSGHRIPPHQINYRANLWALKDLGIEKIIAVASVGGIIQALAPSTLATPEQIIDYTHGRHHTYFGENISSVTHIDFTHPYSESLRERLLQAAKKAAVSMLDRGVYGATQGPRLETAQEILRLERDGCTMVGMTGMPEAALARELELEYVCCAVVANWAAGKSEGIISMEKIESNLVNGMEKVRKILEILIKSDSI